MTVATTYQRPVIVNSLIKNPSLSKDVLLVIAAVLTVSLLAQITIELPLVPITGQTLGVILVGAALGSKRAAAALSTYLLVGLAGLPVFADFASGPAMILSPSFGYLVGFIPAAYFAGYLAEQGFSEKPLKSLLAFSLASLFPFLTGVPYLAFVLNSIMGASVGFAEIISLGFLAFIPGGIVKAGLATLIMALGWKLIKARP